jgi:hypothetical protein
MTMRRALGSLLPAALLPALLLLSGCQDDGGTDPQATDPAPTASSSSTGTAPTSPVTPPDFPDEIGKPVDHRLVAVLHQTGAGGAKAGRVVVLDDPTDAGAFTEGFRGDALRHQIASTIESTEVPEGQTLVGAVVGVGCDVPSDVFVGNPGGHLTITAQPVGNPLPECLAPVTSVALVLVDSDVV